MKHLFSATTLVLVSTAAFAAPVAPGNMSACCRGEASSQFGTPPMYVKTGKKPFQCDYDKKGNFLHLKSLVDEGRL